MEAPYGWVQDVFAEEIQSDLRFMHLMTKQIIFLTLDSNENCLACIVICVAVLEKKKELT